MTQSDGGWSAPSLYAGAGVIQPPMVTGADPMLAPFIEDWDGAAAARHEPQWSSTTYVGPRRHRPGARA
ncbi:MAG: hypothetical protein M3N95_11170, partial [Actinomycetota bacterium]|nr:hypothetical protein [Actinomycetota bacterium]